jgi:D-inositol-3-phosphate glycosyltransferase
MERVALLSLHSSPLAPLGSADAGGMNLYVRRLADGLCSKGLQVDVFTRRTCREAPEIVSLDSGARVIHLAAGPARRLPKSVLSLHLHAMVAALRSFTEQHAVNYDLIHSHYWLSGLVGLDLRAVQAAPLVHMFHTLARVKEFYFGRPDASDTLLRYEGERRVLEGADVIVGATSQELELMRRLYHREPAGFQVIPPGVDVHAFYPHRQNDARRILGIDAGKLVLFVGRHDPIKGLDLLLRSLAAVRARGEQARLIVLGAEQDSVLRKLVHGLELEAAVEFRGLVPQLELPLYYSAADICAVPSAYESFGMVAVEAMACGTPVVAFRVGGLAETIKDGSTGFLATPGSPQSYLARLEAALTCDSLQAMGRRARLSVQRYDWPGIVDRTLQLYHAASASRLRAALPACCGS